MEDLAISLDGLLQSSTGHGFSAWIVGWAQVLPTVVLVPAFGLRALPGPARAALGLGLAACGLPAAHFSSPAGWQLGVLAGFLRGMPVALVAASSLWVATMAGGLIDDMRGAREHIDLPVVPAQSTALGALFGLVAAIAFLTTGGPARVLEALARPEASKVPVLWAVAASLVGGIRLAVSVAAPLVVVFLLFEVMAVLVARAATPAPLQNAIAPLRGWIGLAVLSVVLDRVFALLTMIAGSSP